MIHFTAPMLGPVRGSPIKDKLGYDPTNREAATWLLADNEKQSVGAGHLYSGPSGNTIVVSIFWAMDIATSGSVRLLAQVMGFAPGEDFTVDDPYFQTIIEPVPVGCCVLQKSVLIIVGNAIVDGDILRVTVGRTGGVSGDTAAGGLHLIAVGMEVEE